MQTENKKKQNKSIEDEIKIREEKIRQENNKIKMLKKKLKEEERKKRDKRIYEKGAVFESIFKETKDFSKDEYYELISYANTLDDFKIKILEIEEKRKSKEDILEKDISEI